MVIPSAGDRVDSIDFWSVRIRDLEHRIVEARRAALAGPPTTSWFVFFNNQKDAAIAAQTNIHAEDGHRFRVIEAPGPEEASQQTLHHHHAQLQKTCISTPSACPAL